MTLAEIFYATRRSRGEPRRLRRSRSSRRRRLLFEPLEPRVLLSTDPLITQLVPVVAAAITPQPSLSTSGTMSLTGSANQASGLSATSHAPLNGGIPSDTSQPPSPDPVGPAALQSLVWAAIHRLSSLGFSAEQLTALEGTAISFTDLPTFKLGWAVGHHIWIDRNAGGYGWPRQGRSPSLAAIRMFSRAPSP